jgi:hypothetical protein
MAASLNNQLKKNMTLSRGGKILPVGLEVLTAVAMKNSVFWDITLCRLLKGNRRFRGTFRLILQGRRISHARNQDEKQVASRMSPQSSGSKKDYSSTLKMEAICSSGTSVNFNRLHSVVSRNIELFNIVPGQPLNV